MTGEIIKEIKQEAGMDGLTLSNDGTMMVSGAESQDESKKIAPAPANMYSTKDWSLIRSVDHGATINDVDFTSDDKYFITAGHPYIKVWETKTGKLIDTFETFGKGNFGREYDGFVSARFNQDDSYLAAGTSVGNLYVFEFNDGKLKRRKTINRTGRKIETVTWTPDGKYVLQAGHSPVITFYALDQILKKGIQSRFVPIALEVPLTDNLEYMEFNKAGTLFATAQQDGTVQLFTFMSDDPMVNQNRHKMVKEAQSKVE
jgi:WD40 repeat protein